MRKAGNVDLLFFALLILIAGCGDQYPGAPMDNRRADNALKITEDAYGEPVWLPDGSDILYTTWDHNGFFEISQGSGETVVFSEEQGFYVGSLAISPIDSSLTFTGSDSLGSSGIYKFSLQDLQLSKLTETSVGEANICWSPDEPRIVYDVGSYNQRNIEILNLEDGSRTPLTNNDFDDNRPVWSPDGTRIAFSSNRTGAVEVWSMSPDGTELLQLTTEGGYSPTWAPESDRIAYTRFGTVWIMDRDGENETQLTDLNSFNPVWSPSGDEIAFMTSQVWYANTIWIIPLD